MLPRLSVTVQLIVVVPTGYKSISAWPSLRTPTTELTAQLSEVSGVPRPTEAPHEPGTLSTTTISAGHVMFGGGFDAVTVKLEELFSGSASVVEDPTVAVLLTLVPSATEQSTFVTITKEAGSLGVIADFAQETVPLEPIAGVVQTHPKGAEIDLKVV